MIAYGVRCRLKGLGRLSLPVSRIRFRDGWVRLTRMQDGRVECLLVDREDHALTCASELEAIEGSFRMGQAVNQAVMAFNKYPAGEHPGQREQIKVAVA